MMKYDLAILNGNVVMPGSGVIAANVYLKGDKIAAVSTDVFDAERTIDASGQYVAPGIVNPHIHLGLFAPLADECDTETKAGLLGGITTQGVFFGGPQSHKESFPGIKETVDSRSYTDIIPHLVIGGDNQVAEMADYIKDYGVKSFKVYLNGIPGLIPSVSDEFIMRVMQTIQKTGECCIISAHCENTGMVTLQTGNMMETIPGTEMNLEKFAASHPSACESEAVTRLANLAAFMEFPVYVVHLFTKEGVQTLKDIRPNNPYVSVETVSPYLALNCKDPKDKLLKMEPPFKYEEDTQALWEGIEAGLIDCIGTDNVTMTIAEKNATCDDFWQIMPGYAADQWHLPVCMTEGVVRRGIPIETVIDAMTRKPAQKYGVYPSKGTLEPGADGDVVIFDLTAKKKASASDSATRSDFCIYEGMELTGWANYTIKGGKVAVENGKVTGEPTGKMLKR